MVNGVWTIEEPVEVILQPSTCEMFHKLYSHEMRNLPVLARPSFEGWLQEHISVKCAKAAQKYAETQQNAAIEKYVFNYAKRNNCTVAEACEALKVQIQEKA